MKDLEKIVTVAVAVISLLLGLFNTWTINNPQDSAELVKQGNKYFESKDYKSAILYYEKALKYHSTYSNALKYKGYALFNLGINDPDLQIRLNRPSTEDAPPLFAQRLIEHVNSSDHVVDPASISYLESSYQYLSDAARSNPADVEAILYSGIASLYLMQISPTYDPLKEFDQTLRAVGDRSNKKSIQIRAIKSAAWQGKGVAYLRMGDTDKAASCFRNSQMAMELSQ
jgi:tetratricopeptide (TPR) repeat protein